MIYILSILIDSQNIIRQTCIKSRRKTKIIVKLFFFKHKLFDKKTKIIIIIKYLVTERISKTNNFDEPK